MSLILIEEPLAADSQLVFFDGDFEVLSRVLDPHSDHDLSAATEESLLLDNEFDKEIVLK